MAKAGRALTDLQRRTIQLIDEAELSRQGKPSRIFAKVNRWSITV
jgi:hypothetical protein